MEKITIGFFYINVKLDCDLIKEIEYGLDGSFNFEYYHALHFQSQIHYLSLGHSYICWKGFPYFDKKD